MSSASEILQKIDQTESHLHEGIDMLRREIEDLKLHLDTRMNVLEMLIRGQMS